MLSKFNLLKERLICRFGGALPLFDIVINNTNKSLCRISNEIGTKLVEMQEAIANKKEQDHSAKLTEMWAVTKTHQKYM